MELTHTHFFHGGKASYGRKDTAETAVAPGAVPQTELQRTVRDHGRKTPIWDILGHFGTFWDIAQNYGWKMQSAWRITKIVSTIVLTCRRKTELTHTHFFHRGKASYGRKDTAETAVAPGAGCHSPCQCSF